MDFLFLSVCLGVSQSLGSALSGSQDGCIALKPLKNFQNTL